MSWVVRAPDRDLERSEKRLFSRVRRVLWDYEPLRASHAEILIDVDGPNVRLRGRVRTMPQKLIAAMLVQRMEDVEQVVNDLIADPEVVRSVADSLSHDPRTAPYVVRVDSRHGIVTLRGEMPSEEIREAASALAAIEPQVTAVRNQIAIGGPVLPAVALKPPRTKIDPALPEAATSVPA
jgi:osmotically-inducible protein OsmY